MNEYNNKEGQTGLLDGLLLSHVNAGPILAKVLMLFACGLLLTACATSSPDPYEGLNRRVQSFNDTADQYLLRPAAQAYSAVLPDPVEQMFTNLFNNLGEPLVALNQLLQGKVGLAVGDGGRFLVNTTVGVAGLFDVAKNVGLPRHEEDIGQTLAVWGVGPGPYLVLPFWGPSTVRGAFDRGVRSAVFAIRYVDHVPTRNSGYATWVIVQRADLLGAERLLRGDRYLFMRDAYLQRRDYLINDGVVDDPFLDGDD
jgi:phospholipid-binding lipoprotein MlaA